MMKSSRSQYVICCFSFSCFLWSVILRFLCIFSANTGNVSAFRIHRVESTDNCQDHTLYSWPAFVLTGEPMVFQCPRLQYKNMKLFDQPFNLTWYKNGSSVIIPAVSTRMISQDNALWFLPATLEDSGKYICTQRNASYCAKVSLHLIVVERNASRDISYPQIAYMFRSGKVVCPNLEHFIRKDTNYELRWYKESMPLNIDNKKFTALKNTDYLTINSVLLNDAGYYTCEMMFEYGKAQYNITRTIQLQIFDQKKKNSPEIVSPNEGTILAVLGSQLIIPCKVFLGANSHSEVDIWWLANDSYVSTVYPKGRVKEGETRKLIENNDRYTEVPLIFDTVREADFNTEFRCVAQDSLGHQVQTMKVKKGEKDHRLSRYSAMAFIPVALAAIFLGGAYLNKFWKQRYTKGYIAANS